MSKLAEGVEPPAGGPSAPTLERIVHAGARLFLMRSYASVGLNEICAEAGVQKGSFYHALPSKNALALAVVDQHAAAIFEMLDAREARADGPLAKIRATVDVVGEIQASLVHGLGRPVGCPLGNLALELATTDGDIGRHVAGVLARWEARVAAHCRGAAEAGIFAQGTDPAEFAHQLIATMQGAILLAKVAKDGSSIVPEMMHMVIDGALRHAA